MWFFCFYLALPKQCKHVLRWLLILRGCTHLRMNPSCQIKMRRTGFKVRGICAGFRQRERPRERLVRENKFAAARDDSIKRVVPHEFLKAWRCRVVCDNVAAFRPLPKRHKA